MCKSLLLLTGRLLITLLFLYVGWVQIYRVMMRDWALWSRLEYDSMWRKDGHVSALEVPAWHAAEPLLRMCRPCLVSCLPAQVWPRPGGAAALS